MGANPTKAGDGPECACVTRRGIAPRCRSRPATPASAEHATGRPPAPGHARPSRRSVGRDRCATRVPRVRWRRTLHPAPIARCERPLPALRGAQNDGARDRQFCAIGGNKATYEPTNRIASVDAARFREEAPCLGHGLVLRRKVTLRPPALYSKARKDVRARIVYVERGRERTSTFCRPERDLDRRRWLGARDAFQTSVAKDIDVVGARDPARCERIGSHRGVGNLLPAAGGGPDRPYCIGSRVTELERAWRGRVASPTRTAATVGWVRSAQRRGAAVAADAVVRGRGVQCLKQWDWLQALIQVPNGCLTRLTELDSLDRLAEAILLDGLCRPRKTVIAHLWSRLLQVRALPPERPTPRRIGETSQSCR
jgi:hypothetical protein